MSTSAKQSFQTSNSETTTIRPARSSFASNDFVSHKIRRQHHERLAAVYIRQSSPRQVLENRESTELQYKLAERAVAYGWHKDRVLIVDDDLGQSGRSVENRFGFQRLLAEVGLNHVGLILGIEMSRLARSCKDWYQLLELCAVFDVLLGDQDGLYDPGNYNDRLLLGLKGTMSEAELHLLRSRMDQGRLNKARRGEYFERLPIGYVFGPSGKVVSDPDEQTRSLVQLVFDKFEELGTGRGVVLYMKRNRIRFPFHVYAGPDKGQIEWRFPSISTIYHILRHPFYAGAYVYGRRQVDQRSKVAGQPNSGRVSVPMERWRVLIPGQLPAFITWDQYLANQKRLTNNRPLPTTPGVPREGPTLLGGLVRCGRCDRQMCIHYHTNTGRARYHCTSQAQDCDYTQCQSLPTRELDDLVSRQVLKAVEPAALAASLQAADNIEQERERLHRQNRQELERAKYQADRARRQYDAIEPENRLVAAELEKRWEDALRHQRDLQDQYDRLHKEHQCRLSVTEQKCIEALASDLPTLWFDSNTSAADRQTVTRCLIERVVLNVQGHTEYVDVAIHWAGGFISFHEIHRPIGRYDMLRDYERLKTRLKELRFQGKTSKEIAECLNVEGFYPPRQNHVFSEIIVRSMLARLGLNGTRVDSVVNVHLLGPDECWLQSLSRQLKIPHSVLCRWCCRGWVHGRKVMITRRRWIVWADADEKQRLQRLHAARRLGPTRRYPAELTSPKARPKR